jgi:inhibitor of KinA sporulation pathway (predicted exonuclease)
VETRSLLVRPQNSRVSEFCTRLTTLTPEQVARGVTLAQALETIQREYYPEDRVFASWGDYDRNQFLRNCEFYRIPYPFGPTHWNVKTFFSLAMQLERETGLDAACELLGIEFEGTQHRGVDDAANTALVLARLLERLRR